MNFLIKLFLAFFALGFLLNGIAGLYIVLFEEDFEKTISHYISPIMALGLASVCIYLIEKEKKKDARTD
jgi:succinate dehydrogenase/fumarate reductase cytochrome b subunit